MTGDELNRKRQLLLTLERRADDLRLRITEPHNFPTHDVWGDQRELEEREEQILALQREISEMEDDR